MRKRIFTWLGHEFVELSGEARPGASVEEETRDLFRRFQEELASFKLSLEHTARTRLWARDREARQLGTAARSAVLVAGSRAASSSYVSPYHFDSPARIAIDLLAMRPSRPEAERRPVEFDPPRNYLRFLRYDSLAFFSGLTSAASALEAQLVAIGEELGRALIDAGTDWPYLVRLSFFLHRSQPLDRLRALLPPEIKNSHALLEFSFVDGYAGEGSLLEVEATATVPSD
jgi:enamine deaminase RidA (YjgF/YER057c/UK114 family)